MSKDTKINPVYYANSLVRFFEEMNEKKEKERRKRMEEVKEDEIKNSEKDLKEESLGNYPT